MPDKSDSTKGIKRLIRQFKNEFEQPENTEYYSETDYAVAEKRYVLFRLNHG